VVPVVNAAAHFCKRCHVVHLAAQCPSDLWDADEAERRDVAVARSTFTRWASGYLASLSGLAAAGVKLGKEQP
jgi:hypothetical protein